MHDEGMTKDIQQHDDGIMMTQIPLSAFHLTLLRHERSTKGIGATDTDAEPFKVLLACTNAGMGAITSDAWE